MKTNTRKVLLGLSLLGATAMVGTAMPASADPHGREEVRDAHKQVEHARREVRNAHTPEERRDAKEDLRGEKRDLREEKRENRPGHPGYVRPGTVIVGRPGYVRPSTVVVRPGYVRPGYVRPGTVIGRPGYTNSSRTVSGVVTEDLKGDDFVIQTSSGQRLRVLALKGQSSKISRGDSIVATGSYYNSSFNATSVRITRNR